MCAARACLWNKRSSGEIANTAGRALLPAALAVCIVGSAVAPAFSAAAAPQQYQSFDLGDSAGSIKPVSYDSVGTERQSKIHADAASGTDFRGIVKHSLLDPPHFDSYNVSDPEYRSYLSRFKFMLYYGTFDSKVAKAILAARPTMLITNYEAIGHELRSKFAQNNITVIAYLPIHWTDRPLNSTLQQAKKLLKDGADGLFIDEAATMKTDWEFWYHGKIFETAKRFDNESIVIINPGTTSITERSMQVADIVCFEHEWRQISELHWARDYPGWRFMGISSNEIHNVMGYHVAASTARHDLAEARSLNIAYQYSADHYIWLPSWADLYGGSATALRPILEDYEELNLTPVERPQQTAEAEQVLPVPEPDEHPSTIGNDGSENTAPNQSPGGIPEEPAQGYSTPPSVNHPPKASAGQDQTVTLSGKALTLVLDGSASSDPDTLKISYRWTQTEGPAVALHGRQSAVTSFMLDPAEPSDSELGFRLTVSDPEGAKDSDSVKVHVKIKSPAKEIPLGDSLPTDGSTHENPADKTGSAQSNTTEMISEDGGIGQKQASNTTSTRSSDGGALQEPQGDTETVERQEQPTRQTSGQNATTSKSDQPMGSGDKSR